MLQDRIYRDLFAHKRMMRGLLEGYVEAPWARRIDWADPENHCLDGRHVTRGLAQRETDLVWRLGWEGPEADSFYVVLECQSTVDPHMALRLRAYTALVQDGLVRHEKVPVPTGVVVPMVLHTGRSRWTAERSAAGLTAPMAGLERWRPGFDYLLLDARECAERGPAGWSEVKALFQLDVAAVEKWDGILAKLEERLGGPEGR